MSRPPLADDASPSEGDGPRVCYCMRVQRDTIVDAIRDGAHTLAAVSAVTGAGTGCRTCRIDLLDLLAQYAPTGAAPDDLES